VELATSAVLPLKILIIHEKSSGSAGGLPKFDSSWNMDAGGREGIRLVLGDE
jgi:hypothetical protein